MPDKKCTYNAITFQYPIGLTSTDDPMIGKKSHRFWIFQIRSKRETISRWPRKVWRSQPLRGYYCKITPWFLLVLILGFTKKDVCWKVTSS